MQQFIAVALAHFLALLIPGVDFFLIARTAMTSGWRNATGVCLGIAAANGIFIAAAFGGVSLLQQPALVMGIRLAGGLFLTYLGVAFIRSPAIIAPTTDEGGRRASWARNYGLGITSGLLNPKNALFYASLAAAVSTASATVLWGYGLWMFTVVLVWDVIVAVALGSRAALERLGRFLPWLSRISGGFLVLFGLGMIAALVIELLLD